MPTELLLMNIYAVELAGRGLVHETKIAVATHCLLGINSKVLEYACYYLSLFSFHAPRYFVFRYN